MQIPSFEEMDPPPRFLDQDPRDSHLPRVYIFLMVVPAAGVILLRLPTYQCLDRVRDGVCNGPYHLCRRRTPRTRWSVMVIVMGNTKDV